MKEKTACALSVLSSGNIKVFICKLLSCFNFQLHQTILIANLHQNQLTYLIITYQPTDWPINQPTNKYLIPRSKPLLEKQFHN